MKARPIEEVLFDTGLSCALKNPIVAQTTNPEKNEMVELIRDM